MSTNLEPFVVKWDPKDVEIRTKTVEQALEPLVTKVTSLMNSQGNSGLKKGRSRSSHVLAIAIEKATEEFLTKGEQIAHEHPSVEREMVAALNEVRQAGDMMKEATQDFSDDPCLQAKRSNLVRASRALLSAVTRLLIIADMVDVHILLKSLKVVKNDLENLRKVNSQQELASTFQIFGEDMMELDQKALGRQMDLKDPRSRDDMASARAVMKNNSMMLLTASKAYMSNPGIPEARTNRDYALQLMENAVNTIGNVTTAQNSDAPRPGEGSGFLAAALDDFERRYVVDPAKYQDSQLRPSLEKRLESIISAAAHMADRPNTRDDRRERIVEECNLVRQALQDLLAAYVANPAGSRHRSQGLETALDRMGAKTKDLRRQLCKAVVDHISDGFSQTDIPLAMLVETAKQGGQPNEVAEFGAVFEEHTRKLLEIADLACSMSNNEEGVKHVRFAMMQLESLCPQVVSAARMLAAAPRSKVAQENMDVFLSAWEAHMRLLTEAVDDITPLDLFLSVSENHILDDVNKCVFALQDKDLEQLEKQGATVRGRANRICHVVSAEMDSYDPSVYTQQTMQAVYAFRDNIMPHYAKTVENAISGLTGGEKIDENEFIDACRWVYDGVREIRRAVLSNRAYDDLSSDSEDELGEEPEVPEEQRSRTQSMNDEVSSRDLKEVLSDSGRGAPEEVDRAMMRLLPEEEKQQIAAEVAVFKQEKAKLDAEITKWDETGNDIITLAKQMCMIMMEMTDFTRGRGPLKTTMDVINAAQRISQLGKTMVELAGEIVEQCVQSRTKTDLQGYLKSIVLYTHQLNITSKVKTDITQIGGEMVLSGLESAISLITAAKNLMQAVVQTVKAAYVASTKYKGNNMSTVVVWKMRAPEKKPLIRPVKPEELSNPVRKESRQASNPITQLSQFTYHDEF